MSLGINRITLGGHIGQDPELSYTQSGQAVLKLRLAVNERRKDQSGEWIDVAAWFTVIVWNKRGEALNKILHKGMALVVEGRIVQRFYEDRSGNKRDVWEVFANDVHIVGGRRGQQERDGQPPDDTFQDETCPF